MLYTTTVFTFPSTETSGGHKAEVKERIEIREVLRSAKKQGEGGGTLKRFTEG